MSRALYSAGARAWSRAFSGLPAVWPLGILGFPTEGNAELRLSVSVILWAEKVRFVSVPRPLGYI